MQEEVDSFLQLGAIVPVDPSYPKALLPVFTVPEKDGGSRGVVDASPLNTRVICPHFRMESLATAGHLIRKGDFLTSLDLSKAFLHVPLSEEASRWLCFRWKGIAYSFKAMPFGLNISPLTFTKVMRIPVASIRVHGVRVTIYLDDLLLIASTRSASVRATVFAVLLLTFLGLIVNQKKSEPVPKTSRVYLGLQIDTLAMNFRVPAPKLFAMRTEWRRWASLSEDSPQPVRALAHLIGSTVSLREALPPVHLWLFHLHRLLSAAVRAAGWSATVRMTPEAKADLEWLDRNATAFNGTSFSTPRPSVLMQTDASRFGWGALLKDPTHYLETRGQWSTSDHARMHSISPMELEAGIRAIETFRAHLLGTTCLWRTDNSSVVWGVNKWRSMSPEMNSGLRRLFLLTRDLRLRLVVVHLPGETNRRPDLLSRWVDPEDWQCQPRVFQAVDRLLGPCQLDAFATPLNRLLPRFWSRFPCPEAEGVDALQQNFALQKCWCNPPFSLLLPLFHRIRSQRATAVVLVPQWPSQPWWPEAMAMLAHPPLLLPPRRDLFLPQSTANVRPVGEAP